MFECFGWKMISYGDFEREHWAFLNNFSRARNGSKNQKCSMQLLTYTVEYNDI